jgi:predicted cobalt transporter CbtA
MARKFTKVLALMQENNGRIDLDDPRLHAILGRLMYRVASYMSNIRRRAGLEVLAVRNGRKVVAYELAAVVAPAVASAPAPDASDSTSDTPTAS